VNRSCQKIKSIESFAATIPGCKCAKAARFTEGYDGDFCPTGVLEKRESLKKNSGLRTGHFYHSVTAVLSHLGPAQK
jgi:hypothetical protein